jgi:hypothetical protein
VRWVLRPTRLVLILAVALTAALPALRRELVWNARVLAQAVPHWPTSGYARYLSGGMLAPGTEPDDPAALLRAHPRDVQLRIALASSDPEQPETGIQRRALTEALRLAPRDPVVRSLVALRDIRGAISGFQREELFGHRRAERRKLIRSIQPDWKPVVLSEAKLAPALKALDAWAAADPHNAAPDVFAADLLFGARKDSEALARAEAAANRRFFTLYEMSAAASGEYAARLRGVPAADAAYKGWLGALCFRDAEHVRLRDPARMMQAIGWDHFDRGDKETAFRCWLTAARIGALIDGHEPDTMISRLVGIADEQIGYAPIYKFTLLPKSKAKFVAARLPGSKAKYEGGDYLPGQAYASFVASRGKPAADRIYQRLASLESVRTRIRKASDGPYVLLVPIMWYQAARQVGMLALPAALVAVVLSVLALWFGRRSRRALSRLWSAILIVAAICVPIAICVASRIWNAISENQIVEQVLEGLARTKATGAAALRYDTTVVVRGLEKAAALSWLQPSPGEALAFTFGTPVLLVVLLAIAAAWVARKKKAPYRGVLVGALRQALPTALAVLAVIWVGATATAVRESNAYTRHQDRMYRVGELRMLEETMSGRR